MQKKVRWEMFTEYLLYFHFIIKILMKFNLYSVEGPFQIHCLKKGKNVLLIIKKKIE